MLHPPLKTSQARTICFRNRWVRHNAQSQPGSLYDAIDPAYMHYAMEEHIHQPQTRSTIEDVRFGVFTSWVTGLLNEKSSECRYITIICYVLYRSAAGFHIGLHNQVSQRPFFGEVLSPSSEELQIKHAAPLSQNTSPLHSASLYLLRRAQVIPTVGVTVFEIRRFWPVELWKRGTTVCNDHVKSASICF